MDGLRFKIKRTDNSWKAEYGEAGELKMPANQDLECSTSRKRKFEETVGIVDEENIAIGLINRMLPPEMFEKIFSHLKPTDLMTAMLVCKTWNEAGGRPALWSWVKIKLSDLRGEESEDKFLKMINWKRL